MTAEKSTNAFFSVVIIFYSYGEAQVLLFGTDGTKVASHQGTA